MARRRSRNARRAAVSSYGMTGTNVHAIVEQAPVPAPESGAPGDTPATPGIDGALLFALSASSQDALRQTAARLAGGSTPKDPSWRRRIWPTPWPAGADTGRCAPPYWPPPPRS